MGTATRRWWILVLSLYIALTVSPASGSGWFGTLVPVAVEEEEETRPKGQPPGSTTGPSVTMPQRDTGNVDLRPGPFNLSDEAKKAAHPAQKKLLEDFSRPFDIITFKAAQGQSQVRVEPLPRRFNPRSPLALRYRAADGGREGSLEREQVVDVTHYELRALAEVRKFLGSGLEKAEPPLSRFLMLRTAEMVLTEVLSFHEKAKGTKVRVDGWDGIGSELAKELLQVRIAQINALAGEGEWEAGAALADRLHNEVPSDLKAPIQEFYFAHAWALMDQEDYQGAYKIYKSLGQRYNITPPPGNRVERRMVDRARQRFEEARRLVTEGKRSEAIKALEEAAQAWPDLRGLREFTRDLNKTSPTLVVGVRYLPEQISPTTAATDADRMAVRLVFEPLLRASVAGREGYSGPLGDEPRRTDLEWDFTIPEGVKWADGQPLSTDDILRSVELTMKPGTPLYNPDTEPLQVSARDARRISFTFKRSVLDPMALLCFDLLPAHRLPRERSARDLAYGKNPLGSGPFMLDSITGDELVFKANPHYRRPHAPTGPALSEIRFIRYGNFTDAKSALASGRWQMLLHLTTPEREQLAGIDHTIVATPTEQPEGANVLANPRIWFLAPNYRKPAWQNENLRHAVSLSLDREALLQEVFRGQGKKQHRALTGPYPLGSWAYNPDLTPDKVTAFNPSMARQRAQSSGFSGTLKLRFPVEDEQAANACAAIQKAVEQHAGLRLTLEAMPSQQIAADLASENPTFDLLYWHYDFPNETLSLWPLLDPRAISPNGQNFFGYRGDSELERLFRLIQSRRDFEFVRRRSHEVHDHLWRKMVFIPLWQLDVHVAMHVSLEVRRLHPLYVFDEVETWRRKLD